MQYLTNYFSYFFALSVFAILSSLFMNISVETLEVSAQNITISNNLTSKGNSTIEGMKQNLTEVIENINYITVSNVSAPSVTVDPNNDNIYLSYFETKNNLTNVYLSISKDKGITFSDPVRVNDKEGDANQYPWTKTKIEIGPQNEVYLLWHVIDESNEEFVYGLSSLRLAKSIDGGLTFMPTTSPGNDTLTEKAFFDMAVSNNNTVFISYLDSLSNVTDFTISYPSEVKVLKSLDGGITFDEPITIDKTACDCCKTSAVTSDDGELYMIWRHASHVDSKTYENGSNPYNYEDKLEKGVIYEVIRDVYVTHSTDNGEAESFVKPVLVNEDNWFMNGCPGAGPDLDFDSKGNLHVGWFTGGGNQPGTYYTNSTNINNTNNNNRLNFTNPLPLLTDEWIPTSETNLVVDGQDNVWVTTTDSRNANNSNIFVAVKSSDGKLYKNQEFAIGDDSVISAGKNITAITWLNKDELNLAIIDSIDDV